MLVNTTYHIDLFVAKHSKDPALYHSATKQGAAHALGERLSHAFPFHKNEEISFAGEVPAAALSKEHSFKHVYEQELVVMTRVEAQAILQALAADDLNRAKDLFTDVILHT